MICPNCRIPMNHHADKVVTPRTEAEIAAAAADPVMGGAVLEQHACPRCGLLAEQLFALPKHL